MSSIHQLVTAAEAKDVGDRLGVNFRRFSLEEYRHILEQSASTHPNTDEEWLRLGKIGKTQLDRESPDLQMQTLKFYSGLEPCPKTTFRKMAEMILTYLVVIALTWLIIRSLFYR